jgi:hypothetical protein
MDWRCHALIGKGRLETRAREDSRRGGRLDSLKETLMKRTLSSLLVVLLAAAGASLTLGAAGKPPANPQATVTFMNGPGDNIQSDGRPYVGGVGGVVAELQGGTTILLNIATTSGKNRRYLWYHYPAGTEIATPCDPSGSMGPVTSAGGVNYSGFVSIKSLGAVQIGEVRAVRLHIGGPDEQFLWLSPYNVVTGQCSGVVAAYRQDQWHWQVATSTDRLSVAGGYHGIAPDGTMADAELNWILPSGIAQLGSTFYMGNYSMPLGLTVYCPACAAPAPCPGWAAGTPCAIPKN